MPGDGKTSFKVGQRVRHTNMAEGNGLGTVEKVDEAGTVTVKFDYVWPARGRSPARHGHGVYDAGWFRMVNKLEHADGQ